MTRLTVVVIGAGQNEPFENTLASVLQHRPADCQVLAAFAGEYNDPYDIGGEADLLSVPQTATRAGLLNAALQAAHGAIVHLVAAGVEVEEHWCEPALQHFSDANVATVSPLLINASDPTRVISFGVGYGAGGRRIEAGAGKRWRSDKSPAARIVGPTLTGGFYRRSALRRLGGFDLAVGDELVDVDLAMTLRRLGYTSVFEPQSRLRCERQTARGPRTFGPRTLLSGLRHERLFLRYAGQVGWSKAVLLHPFVVAVQTLTALPNWGAATQLLGRAAGYFDWLGYLRFARRIRAAQQQQLTPPESATPRLKTDHASLDRASLDRAA